VSEFTQKLNLDGNYCFSFRVVILIAKEYIHAFFLSVYESIRTSNPLPTVASRSANSCSNRGAKDCLWANAYTRLAERDARVCSKANSNSHTYNQMPSKLLLWTSDKFSWPPWPWIPTV